MYEYLRSWTGVAVRPAPGALKNTGVINELLLAEDLCEATWKNARPRTRSPG